MVSPRRVVFGVIGDDIHVVANRILAIGLADAGFRAFNLGTHNLVDDFVDAAVEVEADAVLVSSLNGEGEHWCEGFRERFEAQGMSGIVLYIGGNLVVGDRKEDEVVSLFKSWGFDRVFYRHADFNEVFRLLREDIECRASKRKASGIADQPVVLRAAI
jgi:methylaspartate mutase sigma subunit